jgi:hypothetical protein
MRVFLKDAMGLLGYRRGIEGWGGWGRISRVSELWRVTTNWGSKNYKGDNANDSSGVIILHSLSDTIRRHPITAFFNGVNFRSSLQSVSIQTDPILGLPHTHAVYRLFR